MQNAIKLLGSMAAVVATVLLLRGGFAAPAVSAGDGSEPIGCFNVRCTPTTDCSAICGDVYFCGSNGFCQPA